jgi:hypothetical protein
MGGWLVPGSTSCVVTREFVSLQGHVPTACASEAKEFTSNRHDESRNKRLHPHIGSAQLEGSGRDRTCIAAPFLRRRRRRKCWTVESESEGARKKFVNSCSHTKCRMLLASGLARGTDELTMGVVRPNARGLLRPSSMRRRHHHSPPHPPLVNAHT